MKLKKLKMRMMELKVQLSHLRNDTIRHLDSVVVENKYEGHEYEATAEWQWCVFSKTLLEAANEVVTRGEQTTKEKWMI